MKFSFLVILLCVFYSSSFGQTGSVSGKVIDKTGQPMLAATVSLRKLPDSSLVTGTQTGADGSYQIKNIKDGKFYLEGRMVGYPRVKTKAFSISAASPDANMPDITLVEQARALKEVSVVGQRPFIERQADKIIVNVENSIVSSGSTALEVLQRTPGVTIDKDDHLQLKGKAGVTVMLDGKLTYLSEDQISNLLKNMASENISKIEVITNPSAKYDAAGNTGIINIVTKKGRKTGFNGNVTAGYSYGKLPKYNAGLNMNYKTSHFNFFGNINLSQRKNLFLRYNKSVFSDSSYDELTTHDLFMGWHAQYKAGVDITISKNNSLSLTFNGYRGQFTRDGTGPTNLVNGAADTVYQTDNKIKDPYGNTTYSANYKLTLDSTGKELTVDADYAKFHDHTISSQLNTPFVDNIQSGNIISLNNHQPALVTIRSIKSDYTQPIDSNIKLEMGVKGSWVKTDNDFTYDSLVNGNMAKPTTENHFIYTERILAAYASGTFKLKKFTAQAGLRVENTLSVGDLATGNSGNQPAVTTRNYTDLFPNLSLTQKFSDAHQIGFSLSRRINRPDYGSLNPYVFYLDKQSSFIGNPNLKPQYTYSYELNYTFKQKYIATVSYASTRNYFNEFPSVDPATLRTTYTVLNFDRQNAASVLLSAPGDFTSWWTSTNNVSVNYNTYKNQEIMNAPTIGITTYNINIIETFKIPGDWKAELSGFYNSRNFDGTYRFQPMYSISAGLQKTFLNKHADLKANISDIFNTMHFYGNAMYNNVNINIRNKWESRVFTLAFTYRFGGTNPDDSKHKSGPDESSRVGGKG